MTVKDAFSRTTESDDRTPDPRMVALINEARTDTERRELVHFLGLRRRDRR
jgi:hypothetical protein